MKSFLPIFLCVLSLAVNATTYYSQGSLPPNDLNSWNSNPGGGGSIPLSFTNAGDEFIIQTGHEMITSGSWTIGSASSALRIQTGASLEADQPILLTGAFQILDGGAYIHNNGGSVSTTPGASIFGGTLLLTNNSNFEIRNWIDNTTGIPSSFNWGNLIINLPGSLGGPWDWGITSSLTINGNLDIRGTGDELWLSNSGNVTINIIGSLLISGNSLLFMKKNGGGLSGNTITQVNKDISVTGSGSLNVGTSSAGSSSGNYDLRFMGNFSADVGTIVTGSSSNAYLVANGSSPQNFSSSVNLTCNFRILSGAVVNLNSPFTNGPGNRVAVLGTLNANSNTLTFNGPVDVAGGTLASGGSINMNSTTFNVCTGNGNFGGFTGWCTTTGNIGILNFNTGTFSFNSGSSSLNVGITNSHGEVYLSQNANVNFAGLSGSVILAGNGILGFDENSFIDGNAFYRADGGTLIVGSPDGITTIGSLGNIRVGGSRNYNNSNTNNFIYRTLLPQITGNGIPDINGFLKIDNTGGKSVALSVPITIDVGGNLNLNAGNLKTTGGNILTLSDNTTITGGSALSFIEGPVIKIGGTDFTFPVGKSGKYAPVVLTNVFGQTSTDMFQVEYFFSDPHPITSSNYDPGIDHVSYLEYWQINRLAGGASKEITLTVNPYSGVSDMSKIRVVRYDGVTWRNAGNVAYTGTSSGTVQSDVVSSFSPFTLGSTDATNALPLKLLTFNGHKQNDNAILNWIVDKEDIPAYFDLMHSGDGRNYDVVTKINGTDRQVDYEQIVKLAPGLNYFILKLVDHNGDQLMSKVVIISNTKRGFELINASPSVVNYSTTIRISTDHDDKLQFTILSSDGKLVRQFTQNVTQGFNNLNLDCSFLASGIYYIQAGNKFGERSVIRIVKL